MAKRKLKRKVKRRSRVGVSHDIATIQQLLRGIVGDLASAANVRTTDFTNISTNFNRIEDALRHMDRTIKRIEMLAVRIDDSQTQVLQQTLPPAKEERVRLADNPEDGEKR